MQKCGWLHFDLFLRCTDLLYMYNDMKKYFQKTFQLTLYSLLLIVISVSKQGLTFPINIVVVARICDIVCLPIAGGSLWHSPLSKPNIFETYDGKDCKLHQCESPYKCSKKQWKRFFRTGKFFEVKVYFYRNFLSLFEYLKNKMSSKQNWHSSILKFLFKSNRSDNNLWMYNKQPEEQKRSLTWKKKSPQYFSAN